ncbi:MAG: hypothetical protein JST00_40285 [Deltaproteobacteria bacterium]|nr:hypothetical protein [Deltaproteobacteria bacterium]
MRGRHRPLPSRRLVVALALGAACSSVGGPAYAGHDEAMSHFAAGRAHVRAGRCDLAVPEFRASDLAEHNVGALLNLGECLETLGKMEEAYGAFRDAQGLAAERRDDRVAVARAGAERTLAKLVRIVVRAPSVPSAVTLDVDGAPVPRERWSHLLLTAGTSHMLSARAEGCATWTEKVQGRPGESISLAIDLTCGASTPPSSSASRAPERRSDGDPGATQRTVGFVTVAAGGALLAVGGVFGGLTLASRGELADAVAADPRCVGGYPSGTCDPAARSALAPLEDTASSRATASTAFVIAGVGVALVGTLVVLLAPRGSTTASRAPLLGARF